MQDLEVSLQIDNTQNLFKTQFLLIKILYSFYFTDFAILNIENCIIISAESVQIHTENNFLLIPSRHICALRSCLQRHTINREALQRAHISIPISGKRYRGANRDFIVSRGVIHDKNLV